MPRLLLVTLLTVAVVVLALPAAIGSIGYPVFRGSAAPSGLTEASVSGPVADGADSIPVRVYFPATDTVTEMPLGEYLKGVVAAEMPPDFEMEALKAQFVVARSYVVRRMRQFGGTGGCPPSPEADICADHTVSQAYMTLDQLAARSGRLAAERFWQRLSQAQEETAGEVLTYHGELIEALYHAVSGRATENAEEYFSTSAPYLVSVDDRWGADAPALVTQTRFDPDEFAAKLEQNGTAPVLAVAAATRAGRSPVEVLQRTSTGRVKLVRIGDVELSGREFRERLGLRSTDFRVFLEEGQIVVETVGSGHGVGMSQWGANGMARAGKGYVEILQHYYPGVRLSRLFES